MIIIFYTKGFIKSKKGIKTIDTLLDKRFILNHQQH
ncbi:MAG: hypothetical protein ACI8ZA_002378 [Gammaproteobacteria bacterium]|jgi:hypothetical protein